MVRRELYDHRRDTGGASFDHDGENVNLAAEADHEEIVKQHHALILGYIKLPTVVTT